MTNFHILSVTPKIVAKFSASCLFSTLSLLLANSASAADATPDDQTMVTAASNYKVAESIPIDRLIQKVYTNSPLNTSLLRKVLVDANPKIITGNPQQRVKAGTVIVVPPEAEIIRSTLTPRSTSTPEAADKNPAASDYQARKQWVRFP